MARKRFTSNETAASGRASGVPSQKQSSGIHIDARRRRNDKAI